MKTCVNFTAAQVLTALRGEVVVVREAVKPQPPEWARKATNVFLFQQNPNEFAFTGNHPNLGQTNVYPYTCPYTIGNALWVRETWYDYLIGGDEIGIIYKATHPKDLPQPKESYGRWRSPAIMGRDYSRLNVTVKSVTVEQVDGGWEWVAEMVKTQS